MSVKIKVDFNAKSTDKRKKSPRFSPRRQKKKILNMSQRITKHQNLWKKMTELKEEIEKSHS